MSEKNMIGSLDLLVRVRGSEVERLEADLARQEATRSRYQANLDRLSDLATGSGASGALPPALALNCGHYKEAVFALADVHRADLHLHQANMQVAQRALAAAWTRHEVLGMVLEKQRAAAGRVRERATRKREDETATAAWLAGRA
jgi:flagellar export protein FliJ